MSYSDCLDVSQFLTEALRDEAVCHEVRMLRAEKASTDRILDAISRHAPASVASNARLEMAELPAYTFELILNAWEVASASKKPLTVISERPTSTLKFARDRKVSINIAADQKEIRVAVQHVAGRHADWYKAAAV